MGVQRKDRNRPGSSDCTVHKRRLGAPEEPRFLSKGYSSSYWPKLSNKDVSIQLLLPPSLQREEQKSSSFEHFLEAVQLSFTDGKIVSNDLFTIWK